MLISFASAAPAAAAASPDMMETVKGILPLLVIFVLFYFMMIRPQQKKMKETADMLKTLQKGDEVVTSSGVLAKVSKLSDDFLTLEIADGVEIVVQRAAVAAKLEKGTIKAKR
ncbi:preprotein translocase subunit YajC [Burkholderiaceae bacterium DAT-1]|nr:preprotein translocase subunit YajC [Burkholderiaceae bacterium DAT-1]